MYLTITIDTEEDNWGEFVRPAYTVENLTRLPRLQAIFDRWGVRPTYLVTHPVATSSVGVEVIGGFRARGACEVGTHPHPCNTPPVEEDRTEHNSYICYLPSALQYRKIDTLTRVIEANFGVRPTSYRSGRWGFDEEIARNLVRLGYRVDTSVYPRWNWEPGPDFSSFTNQPFTYTFRDSGAERRLLEVPATVDFLQGMPEVANRAFQFVNHLPVGGKLLLGGLKRVGALNRVCLSPEVAETQDMIRLARTVESRGLKVCNFFFHSPTLLEGCTPFTRTPADVDAFLARIDGFLAFAHAAGYKPVTMSELSAADVGATAERGLGAAELDTAVPVR